MLRKGDIQPREIVPGVRIPKYHLFDGRNTVGEPDVLNADSMNIAANQAVTAAAVPTHAQTVTFRTSDAPSIAQISPQNISSAATRHLLGR